MECHDPLISKLLSSMPRQFTFAKYIYTHPYIHYLIPHEAKSVYMVMAFNLLISRPFQYVARVYICYDKHRRVCSQIVLRLTCSYWITTVSVSQSSVGVVSNRQVCGILNAFEGDVRRTKASSQVALTSSSFAHLNSNETDRHRIHQHMCDIKDILYILTRHTDT